MIRQRGMIGTPSACQWRRIQFHLNISQYIVALLQVCLSQQFVGVYCIMDCVQEFLRRGFPSGKTFCACSYNELIHIHDCPQVVFSDESRFILWYCDVHIHVICYSCECHLLKSTLSIIQRHTGRMPSVIIWSYIGYHGKSQLLIFVGKLNNNCYIT